MKNFKITNEVLVLIFMAFLMGLSVVGFIKKQENKEGQYDKKIEQVERKVKRPKVRQGMAKMEAYIQATREVERHLKAPKTAKHASFHNTDFEPIEKGWRVKGYVDAQNSFGAMIRTAYDVEIVDGDRRGEIKIRNLNLY